MAVIKNWILKSTLSQKRIDEWSCFVACSCKLRKVKSCFNTYWVGLVNHGCGLLGYGTLKSAFKNELID